jgi:uncharacterized protein (TIGR01244 family)
MPALQYLYRRSAMLGLLIGLVSAPAWGGGGTDLPNFQKVDDRVYRGAQPSEAGFQELARRGIRTVIDLRDIGEHSQADEEKIVATSGMRYISIPMHGLSTPKEDKVSAVLALLRDPANGPVFVHCKRGADRTGMVVAVYRIASQGWDNGKALHEAKSYGMSVFERAIQHYVLEYKAPQVIATTSSTPNRVDEPALNRTQGASQ